MRNHTSFFCNRNCEYFPCHETKDPSEFNCLFCYCPLYYYGDRCGGHFKITKKGVKSCIDCTIPHHPNSAEYINKKLKELNTGRPDERTQLMVCLDLEGVLFPEIWEAVAREYSVPELARTTRDEPSYDALMKSRMELCREHGITLPKILAVIEKTEPLPGALEFIGKVRSFAHISVISDTFEDFARPVERKLGTDVICNSLETDEEGYISGYRMRCRDTKVSAVKAFQAMGYRVFASGDGFNDIGMIRAADSGCLLDPPERVAEESKGLPCVPDLEALYESIVSLK